MPISILMPALSPTMEEGTLAKWLVNEGDTVSSGDVIAEIETDKATMEVEAVDEGTMGKILVPGGTEGVKVNAQIAILLEDGEDASAMEAMGNAGGAPSPVDASTPPTAAESGAASSAGAVPHTAAAAPAASTSSGGRTLASPLARRLAGNAGIDVAAIAGSGPRGRVVKRDVEAAKANGVGAGAAAMTPGGATQAAASAGAGGGGFTIQPMADDKIMALFDEGSYEVVPHTGMRKTIAKRLTEAKTTIPHFYLSIDCRLDTLLATRKRLNDMADGRYKISVNDFVIKALALGLRDVPDANATWTEAGMLKHTSVDVGVAVAVEGGLFTPVIRRADEKSLAAISNAMKDLAGRARDKKLAPHEYQGGSTSVSNLGMFGIRRFDAVINPPHATILSVGAGEQRVIPVDGVPTVATMMSCTLSCDHRVVDGALGAAVLASFKRYVEDPLNMLA